MPNVDPYAFTPTTQSNSPQVVVSMRDANTASAEAASDELGQLLTASNVSDNDEKATTVGSTSSERLPTPLAVWLLRQASVAPSLDGRASTERLFQSKPAAINEHEQNAAKEKRTDADAMKLVLNSVAVVDDDDDPGDVHGLSSPEPTQPLPNSIADRDVDSNTVARAPLQGSATKSHAPSVSTASTVRLNVRPERSVLLRRKASSSAST